MIGVVFHRARTALLHLRRRAAGVVRRGRTRIAALAGGAKLPTRLVDRPRVISRGRHRALAGLLEARATARRVTSTERVALSSLRQGMLVLPAMLAIAICVLGGIALSRTTDGEEGASTATRSGLTVQLPPGWELAESDTGGTAIHSAFAAMPSEESKAGLVVGKLRSQAVAEGILKGAQRGYSGRIPVRLGRLNAWRYAELRIRAGLVGFGYVVPTTAGAVLVICHASPTEERARLEECDRAAGTLVVRGERPRALTADGRSNERLIRTIAKLRSSRSEALRRFSAADRAEGHVRAATSLKHHYLRAARSLAGLPPLDNGHPLDGMTVSLREAAAAYDRLARAAARGRRSAYRQAARELIRKEEGVRQELARASAA